MKRGLGWLPSSLADRAGPAGGASVCHTIRARRALQVGLAGGHVVAIREGIDGAGGPTRLLRTCITRAYASSQRNGPRQDQRTAIGRKKPRAIMHQKTDGRAPRPQGAQRPALERLIGRAAERVERMSLELGSKRIKGGTRPSVQRIRRTVLIFCTAGEYLPEPRLIGADQQEGPRRQRELVFWPDGKAAHRLQAVASQGSSENVISQRAPICGACGAYPRWIRMTRYRRCSHRCPARRRTCRCQR